MGPQTYSIYNSSTVRQPSMKRITDILIAISAVFSVLSCSKEGKTESYDFSADFEQDKPVSEVKITATTTSDITEIEADIILNLNGTIGAITSQKQPEETLEISLGSSNTSAKKYAGVYYVAAALAEGDNEKISEIVRQKGGKWVFYVSGTLSNPIFIDCMEGFTGKPSSGNDPKLYMHTDLFSRISSFSANGSVDIAFTLKQETNE